MVGVPGKSKACVTCRKRRAKCDLRQPECGQCLRARIACGGYGKQTIFVNSTVESSNDGSVLYQKATYDPFRKQEAGPPTQEQHRRDRVSRSTQSPSLLPQFLARSAYEEKIVGQFWSLYLPNGQTPTNKIAQYSHYSWTNVTQELYVKKNPTIRIALLADALGLMGKRENLDYMLRKSQQMYGCALLAVEQSLRNPTKRTAYEVLTSLKLLSFHELWCSSNGKRTPAQFQRWTTHINGITAYVLASGPEAYVHGYAHVLFLDIRLLQAVVGMQLRRPSPLAEKQWKTIPWGKKKKAPKDTLLDLMLDFPGIYAEADNVEACRDEATKTERRKLFSSKCWALRLELQNWAATCGRDALELAESKIQNPNLEHSPFTTSEDFALGYLALQYWTSCILFYDVARSHAISPESSTKQWPQDSDPLLYCRKITYFLPFFRGSNSGFHFMSLAVLPVASALRYINKTEGLDASVEKRRLLEAFQGYFSKTASGIIDSFRSYETLGANMRF